MARIVRPIKVDAPWDIVGIDVLGLFHQAFYYFSDRVFPVRAVTPAVLCLTFPRTVPRDTTRKLRCDAPHRLLQQMARSISSAEDRRSLCGQMYF